MVPPGIAALVRSRLRGGRAGAILWGMLLALATRSDLPTWEIDDRHLHAGLRARGVAFEQPVWDDPAVAWGRYDGVLIRTTWDYQDKLPAFRAWVQRVEAATRLWNPAEVVVWNTHKHYLRQLQAAGVPLATTVWLDRGQRVEIGSLVRESGFAQGFLKPCVGATARETLRFAATSPGIAAAQAHVDRLLPEEDLMLQPFLCSVLERGEWSAIFVDGQIAHCVRKIPVPGDYRVQDDFGARDEPYTPTATERAVAEHAMAVVWQPGGPCPGADGTPLLYGRTDFLWAEDGSCVLTELELVEPSLFLRHAPATGERLADAWLQRLRGR
jgi:glutathione synthase/RimK-type ligase-like ATP-grasp enzyme